jgi:hypothetical protein
LRAEEHAEAGEDGEGIAAVHAGVLDARQYLDPNRLFGIDSVFKE